MSKLYLLTVTILSVIFVNPCWAVWEEVSSGVDYQKYDLSGPLDIFVVRMDRSDSTLILDSSIGQGKLIGGTETVTGMANRYEDSIGYWGQIWGTRYDVIAAINGDFFSGGIPTSGQVTSGWYAKRFSNVTGGSGFAWTMNRVTFMGDCISHNNNKQVVSYINSGQTQKFQGVNVTRGSDDLILYTPQYDTRTGTNNLGIEVLVELNAPSLIMPTPNKVLGTVKGSYNNTGNIRIPYGHVVLSAAGSAVSKLLNNSNVGREIGISQEITDYAKDCSTSGGRDWTKTYASIGGNFVFLRDSTKNSTTNVGLTNLAPRTAVAYNDNYIYFIVVDGRSSASIGINMDDLGDFCLNELSATHGINQDGGGSSAIWVDGEIKNDPSDGSERSVSNGYLLVRVLDKQSSSSFSEGETVLSSIGGTQLRQGPGTQFPILTNISAGTEGTISSHTLNGVYAKGAYWWNCTISGAEGWASQTQLTSPASGTSNWVIYK